MNIAGQKGSCRRSINQRNVDIGQCIRQKSGPRAIKFVDPVRAVPFDDQAGSGSRRETSVYRRIRRRQTAVNGNYRFGHDRCLIARLEN